MASPRPRQLQFDGTTSLPHSLRIMVECNDKKFLVPATASDSVTSFAREIDLTEVKSLHF